MILNGISLPNPNWGYKTTIEMPLSFTTLGNGKISNYDSGQKYDKYMCKCKFVLTESEQNSLHSTIQSSRGTTSKLQESTGFYPFSISITQPVGGYDVYIKDYKPKGMIDDIGKTYESELTFVWSYAQESIVWKPLNVEYCDMGALTFLNYENIRYPKFKPNQGYSVSIQNTHGGSVYGINLPSLSEQNTSKFTLELHDDIALNLIYQYLNIYRGNTIAIEGGENYFIFTLSEGDQTSFNVKTTTAKFTISHKAHDRHEIDFELVKV